MPRELIDDADRLDRKVDTVLTEADLKRLEARRGKRKRAALVREWLVEKLDALDAQDALNVDTDVPARNGG